MNKLTIKEFDQNVATAFLNSFITDGNNKILLLNSSINFITGQEYKGVQRVLLPLGAYATFNQIKKAGGKIKKGAKSIDLTFLKENKKTSKKAFKGAKLDKKTGLYTAVSIEPRSYNLFKRDDLEDLEAIEMLKSDGAKRYEFNKLIETANKFNTEANKDLKDLSMYIASCMAANLAFIAPVTLNSKDFKHFEKLIRSDASIVRRAFDLAEKCVNDAIKSGAGAIAGTKEAVKAAKNPAPKEIKSCASVPSAPKQEIKSMEQVIQDYHLDNYGNLNGNCVYACTAMDLSKLYC